MGVSRANDKAKDAIGREEQIDPEAFDPVLEAFKRDIDFSLVERNLRLTTEQRAQQLVKATRFIRKFQPVVVARSSQTA